MEIKLHKIKEGGHKYAQTILDTLFKGNKAFARAIQNAFVAGARWHHQEAEKQDPDLVKKSPRLNDVLKELQLANKCWDADRKEILRYRSALERIGNMRPEQGRENCTYSDTEFQSNAVVYGFNLALDSCKQIASQVLSNQVKEEVHAG